MHEPPNAALVLRLYETRELEDLTEIFAEHAVWEVPGRSLVSGVYSGLGEIREYFAKVAELTQGTFRAEPLRVFASDDFAAVLHWVNAWRQGQERKDWEVAVFEVSEGRIAKGRLFVFDLYAHDDFFGFDPDICPYCSRRNGHDPDCPNR